MCSIKNKAITFSFDDGVMQDFKIIEILNKYNMKATFNLNSGRFGCSFPLVWDGVNVERKIVFADMVKEGYFGHEVAAHTVTHARLKSISEDDIVKQITTTIATKAIIAIFFLFIISS